MSRCYVCTAVCRRTLRHLIKYEPSRETWKYRTKEHSVIWCGLIRRTSRPGPWVPVVQAGYLALELRKRLKYCYCLLRGVVSLVVGRGVVVVRGEDLITLETGVVLVDIPCNLSRCKFWAWQHSYMFVDDGLGIQMFAQLTIWTGQRLTYFDDELRGTPTMTLTRSELDLLIYTKSFLRINFTAWWK